MVKTVKSQTISKKIVGCKIPGHHWELWAVKNIYLSVKNPIIFKNPGESINNGVGEHGQRIVHACKSILAESQGIYDGYCTGLK